MSPTPYVAKQIMNPRDAIASHVRWKITLLMAARMREPLSARATRSIEHPEECSIGKWLLSRQTLQLGRTPENLAVLDRHVEFHRQMLRIANLIHAGDFDAAERLLNCSKDFENASNSLANAIMALDRV